MEYNRFSSFGKVNDLGLFLDALGCCCHHLDIHSGASKLAEIMKDDFMGNRTPGEWYLHNERLHENMARRMVGIFDDPYMSPMVLGREAMFMMNSTMPIVFHPQDSRNENGGYLYVPEK